MLYYTRPSSYHQSVQTTLYTVSWFTSKLQSGLTDDGSVSPVNCLKLTKYNKPAEKTEYHLLSDTDEKIINIVFFFVEIKEILNFDT